MVDENRDRERGQTATGGAPHLGGFSNAGGQPFVYRRHGYFDSYTEDELRLVRMDPAKDSFYEAFLTQHGKPPPKKLLADIIEVNHFNNGLLEGESRFITKNGTRLIHTDKLREYVGGRDFIGVEPYIESIFSYFFRGRYDDRRIKTIDEAMDIALWAKAAGWKAVKLHGSNEEKEHLWLAAKRAGLIVRDDFTPSLETVEKWHGEVEHHIIEKIEDACSDIQDDLNTRPLRPEEKENYRKALQGLPALLDRIQAEPPLSIEDLEKINDAMDKGAFVKAINVGLKEASPFHPNANPTPPPADPAPGGSGPGGAGPVGSGGPGGGGGVPPSGGNPGGDPPEEDLATMRQSFLNEIGQARMNSELSPADQNNLMRLGEIIFYGDALSRDDLMTARERFREGDFEFALGGLGYAPLGALERFVASFLDHDDYSSPEYRDIKEWLSDVAHNHVISRDILAAAQADLAAGNLENMLAHFALEDTRPCPEIPPPPQAVPAQDAPASDAPPPRTDWRERIQGLVQAVIPGRAGTPSSNDSASGNAAAEPVPAARMPDGKPAPLPVNPDNAFAVQVTQAYKAAAPDARGTQDLYYLQRILAEAPDIPEHIIADAREEFEKDDYRGAVVELGYKSAHDIEALGEVIAENPACKEEDVRRVWTENVMPLPMTYDEFSACQNAYQKEGVSAALHMAKRTTTPRRDPIPVICRDKAELADKVDRQLGRLAEQRSAFRFTSAGNFYIGDDLQALQRVLTSDVALDENVLTAASARLTAGTPSSALRELGYASYEQLMDLSWAAEDRTRTYEEYRPDREKFKVFVTQNTVRLDQLPPREAIEDQGVDALITTLQASGAGSAPTPVDQPPGWGPEAGSAFRSGAADRRGSDAPEAPAGRRWFQFGERFRRNDPSPPQGR